MPKESLALRTTGIAEISWVWATAFEALPPPSRELAHPSLAHPLLRRSNRAVVLGAAYPQFAAPFPAVQ